MRGKLDAMESLLIANATMCNVPIGTDSNTAKKKGPRQYFVTARSRLENTLARNPCNCVDNPLEFRWCIDNYNS